MKSHKSIRDMIVLAMLGALIFTAKIVFEALPNIHPIAMLIMVITVVYRGKALGSVYIFVFILGLYYGFPQWWIPHMYLWTVLWGITMLIPRNLPDKVLRIVYPIICCFAGLSFGTLYAPAQALMYGYDLSTTIKWIIVGLRHDVIHAVSNFAMGLLVLPLSKVVKKLI